MNGGDVEVVVGVVGHVKREQQARDLTSEVGATVCNIDDGTLRCEGNHFRVLSDLWALSCMTIGDLDGWCVVLEDDAQPWSRFRDHLDEALQHAPAPIVGLYLGTGNPSGPVQIEVRQAVFTAIDTTKDAWLVGDFLLNTVGYAMRADLIEDLLDCYGTIDGEPPMRITRWAQSRKHEICYTCPSLVNHADDDPINPCPPGRLERRAWAVGTPVFGYDTGAVRIAPCPPWSAP